MITSDGRFSNLTIYCVLYWYINAYFKLQINNEVHCKLINRSIYTDAVSGAIYGNFCNDRVSMHHDRSVSTCHRNLKSTKIAGASGTASVYVVLNRNCCVIFLRKFIKNISTSQWTLYSFDVKAILS